MSFGFCLAAAVFHVNDGIEQKSISKYNRTINNESESAL